MKSKRDQTRTDPLIHTQNAILNAVQEETESQVWTHLWSSFRLNMILSVKNQIQIILGALLMKNMKE